LLDQFSTGAGALPPLPVFPCQIIVTCTNGKPNKNTVMKNLPLKVAAVLFSMVFSFHAQAQLTDLGRLFTSGAEDGTKLLEAYLTPFPTAFGATLNAGWYNTAKTHRFPGFDLTLSVNLAFVPDEAKSFSLNDLQLSPNTRFPEGAFSPTVSGPSGDTRPQLEYVQVTGEQESVIARYTLPQGAGLSFIPAPTLQLGVGVPFGTDLIVRYTPEVSFGGGGNMGLWGAGIKHDIKQWLPFIRRAPVFNLAVMGGYTNFYTGAGIDFRPENIRGANNSQARDRTSNRVSFDDQHMNFRVQSITANLIGSADLPFFTAYAGIGVNSTTANIKMTGWFPVPTIDPENPSVIQVTDNSAIKDPVDFTMGGDYRGAQPRITAGGKVKLAILHIHFDYTWSNYSVVTGGLGISFR
jgi:hypothetical protein